MVVVSRDEPLRHFSRLRKSKVLDENNGWALILDVCAISYFSVNIDEDNVKEVLKIANVTLSLHKEANPDDSVDFDDIGLSSEEEAEDLEPDKYVRRKFDKPAPPPPEPLPRLPQLPGSDPTPGSVPSTDPVPLSTGETTTLQVPVSAVKQLHTLLGQIIQGQTPTVGGSSANAPSTGTEEVPFQVDPIKRGEKQCKICHRSFYSTDTYRRHMKTHTGNQSNVCPNDGCNRKLASARSLREHLTTCGKPKDVKCTVEGCNKAFATQQALGAHLRIHQDKLTGDAKKCPGCPKADFEREKSKKDHWRNCPGNPDRVGPFPCPVAGCPRDHRKPFNQIRNLNQHLQNAHKYDSEHTKE